MDNVCTGNHHLTVSSKGAIKQQNNCQDPAGFGPFLILLPSTYASDPSSNTSAAIVKQEVPRKRYTESSSRGGQVNRAREWRQEMEWPQSGGNDNFLTPHHGVFVYLTTKQTTC